MIYDCRPPGFTLTAGNTLNVVEIAGTASDNFNGLADGALVGTFGGVIWGSSVP